MKHRSTLFWILNRYSTSNELYRPEFFRILKKAIFAKIEVTRVWPWEGFESYGKIVFLNYLAERSGALCLQSAMNLAENLKVILSRL